MDMICDNCKKKEVCKYIEEIQEFEKKQNNNNIPAIITISYNCKYKDTGQFFR